MLDSSLPEDDELEEPEPLDDSVLVDGVAVVVDDSVPVEVPVDLVAVDAPLVVDAEDASVFDVVFLLESAGSCPEASCT